ncbi:MAG TPA: thiosulfate oxidation carrier protein SoxY [Burkholderiales bacterium]|nr:thiosulfate oxidation carrier protein SoxY [Burkholderiales bacterium]
METIVEFDRERRDLLKAALGAAALAAAGFMRPGAAVAQGAWNKNAFASKTLDEVVKAYGGARAEPTSEISWGSTPEIAENGAVVPVSVTSRIANTESIAILIEKNPNALAARFQFPEGTDPTVSTRVKIGQSSNVHALIKTKDGKFYVATREVKVTLGGCGG